MANLIQIDLNKILENTPYKDRRVVGVALSGGRDSIALCHVIKEAGESVVAINVEHGIRGEASKQDSEFVADFCKERGIKLYSFSVDAPTYAKKNGKTIEQSARILRYEVFDECLNEGICDVIALAHHADDQAETILMRILRGTGTKGLVGMREVSGRFVRPLLSYSRDDINEYVKAHDLAYVEDETNADLTYSRNFLRAELERIKSRYPDLENSFARLSRVACETEEFLDSVLPKPTLKDGEVYISSADCENQFVLKRLLLKACEMLGVSQDIEEKHLFAVVELAKNEAGKRLYLSHGIVAHKDAIGIVITRENLADKTDEICVPFAIGEFENAGVIIVPAKKVVKDETKAGVLFADLDKIPDGALIRTRRDGDFICKFGGGTKSVGDFLTDKKIPLRTRDSLRVLAKGREVYAIFGVEISAKVKVDEGTKHIVKLLTK